ncbi:MAG: preprotein translocase subunit TatB [Deltaproteobacteria bacterium RIFOXYD12_FULL_57_12]|nr:MAG: preprotein translocase subunit TatB [Deltaproteobacteria bacterium RIFOXYD12_FULL_57_12]
MAEMKFEKVSDTEYNLDVCGFVCPHPQLYAKKSLEKIAEGAILNLVFDNPSSKETIVQMCEAAGNDIIESKTEGGKIYLKIEKG